jgi:ribose 5-phosphate isomerase B
MRIAVTADHNGAAVKAALVASLSSAGHDVSDLRAGTDEAATVDYPALCAQACRYVVAGLADRAVVVGGSGQGEHIACNKIRGIRAGLALDRFGVEISAAHNASNVLVLPAKVLDRGTAVDLVELWLATPFKGGVHQDRIDQIAALERGEALS